MAAVPPCLSARRDGDGAKITPSPRFGTQFRIGGKWHTWIDYARFHALLAAGQPFDELDYVAPTPEWALFGSEERGFDPVETRVRRKGIHKTQQQGC